MIDFQRTSSEMGFTVDGIVKTKSKNAVNTETTYFTWPCGCVASRIFTAILGTPVDSINQTKCKCSHNESHCFFKATP